MFRIVKSEIISLLSLFLSLSGASSFKRESTPDAGSRTFQRESATASYEVRLIKDGPWTCRRRNNDLRLELGGRKYAPSGRGVGSLGQSFADLRGPPRARSR